MSNVAELIYKGKYKLEDALSELDDKRAQLLRQSLGYFYMAEQEPNLTDDDKIEIYSYSAIGYCYLKEWHLSLKYENLTYDIKPKHHRAKIAEAFRLMCSLDGVTYGELHETVECFQEYYQNIKPDEENHDDLFFELSMDTFVLNDLAVNLDGDCTCICDCILSAPWDTLIYKFKDPETIKTLKNCIEDFKAEVHFLLAMME
ncbi:MAG TPA: hypothetical protein VLH94_03400 [Spirochaetia bacterium]|nr:hypothetical protein [Spirochaetia bacterium]